MAQDRRDHRRRGCLSMRTSHGDGVWLESHQLREHLGARDHGNRAAVCFDYLRVVVTNGCRAHHDVRVAHVLSRVTFKDLHTHLLQAVGNVGTLQIGAGNAKAEIDKHLGDAGHTDASDAYEMDVLNATEHL